MEGKSTGSDKGKGKPRRVQVANACVPCRNAKLRCSGDHPICTRCHDRGYVCEYDVSEGMTKREQLRSDLTTSQNDLQQALGILDNMRQGTDLEATESLARLRIGSSLDAEYRRIQTNRANRTSGQSQRSSRSVLEAQQQTLRDENSTLYLENQRSQSLLSPRSQQLTQQDGQQHWTNAPGPSMGYLLPENEAWRTDFAPIDPRIQSPYHDPSQMGQAHPPPESGNEWPDPSAGGSYHPGGQRRA